MFCFFFCFWLCPRFNTFCNSQLFLLDWGAIVGTERTKYVYNQDAVCSVEGPVLLLCFCLGPTVLVSLIFFPCLYASASMVEVIN